MTGGGWTAGSKSGIGSVADCLKHGISIVSVEYRFIADAEKDGVKPPVQAPLHDAARALQFVRSKASEWNIDKTRIGASGGSAGACSSLWIAFHDDMADPKSDDPIARESTRLMCAAVTVAQTSLDPQQMKEWTPNSNYGGHAFGFKRVPAYSRNWPSTMMVSLHCRAGKLDVAILISHSSSSSHTLARSEHKEPRM